MALLASALVPASVPNWQLVTSSAPTGVNTVTFSGLAGYSKYRVVMNVSSASTGSNPSLVLTVNGDTTSGHYITAGSETGNTSPAGSYLQGGINLGLISTTLATANSHFAQIEIDNALTLSPKSLDVWSVLNNATSVAIGKGLFTPTPVITSLALVISGATTQSITGTVYLEGAN